MNADNSRKDIFQNNLYKQTLDNLDNHFNSSDSIHYHHKKQLYNSINNQCNYDNIPNQIHTNSNISIIHFNARSLIKNFNSITNYLYSLHHKFDIIVISETWLNEYNKDLYFILDYNNIHITRNHKRGGGTSIFVKKSFKYITIDTLSTTLPNKFDIVTIKLIIPNSKDIIISGIYKCPEFDIINFLDEIYNLFNTLSTDNTIFLCGDFNIDILKLTCPKVSHFIDILISLGLHPIITKPSRITNITSTLIDNIYTNYNHVPISNGLLYNDISDHLPIFCIYKLNKFNNSIKKNNEFIYYMTQNNISEFKLYLLNYNWSALYRIDNAHHAFDLFISTLENSKQKFLSKKKIYTKNSYLNKPWLIEGLKNV